MAEPPAARAPGVAGVAGARATYDWLHAAYEDLHWTIHNLVAEGDWVVAHTTMSVCQVGPFVTYTPDGEVGRVFAPTGRSFAVTQTHWFRIANGQLIEHHANRDDMGQAMQLGWMWSHPGTHIEGCASPTCPAAPYGGALGRGPDAPRPARCRRGSLSPP
jgi:predicted ester cyclase